MMNTFAVIDRLLAGVALGILFYAGLWLTVRHLPHARHPVAMTLMSFWVRTLVVISGLLWAIHGRWQYAVVCFAGLWMGRIAVSRMVFARQRGENAHHSR